METLNNKMLHFPVFNEDERGKWLTRKGFSVDGYKVKNTALWDEIQNNCPAGVSLYLGGLKEIGDKLLLRPRV